MIFAPDRSKAVPMLAFFFVCLDVGYSICRLLNMLFVLSLIHVSLYDAASMAMLCTSKIYYICTLSKCKYWNSFELERQKKGPSAACAQRIFGSACAFAQSDQNLPWAHWMQSFFLWTTKDLDQTAWM